MDSKSKRSRALTGVVFWFISIILMFVFLAYQKGTGPTYPAAGTAKVGSYSIKYSLKRSENVGTDLEIRIKVPDEKITGKVKYRRYRSNDDWQFITMNNTGGELIAHLPSLESAGKYQYYVLLSLDGTEVSLTGKDPVVERYKGKVPGYILIPHIVFMMLAILVSIRTALESFRPHGHIRPYMYATVVILFIGGMILGPIVQKFAFGVFWSGVPFGYDLTDNKTLIAFIGWIFAVIVDRAAGTRPGAEGSETHQSSVSRVFVILAAILMLGIYAIPHSVMGSERDYTQEEAASSDTSVPTQPQETTPTDTGKEVEEPSDN